MVDFLFNGHEDADWTLVLAHGAGAPMDSPFMEAVAEMIANGGIRVVRFEFPYMADRRVTGRKRPPDRQPVLLDSWRTTIDTVPAKRLAIGGKSMGGRMASLIADETNVDALVCLGYPFHPPGKPDKLRTEHLQELRTPTLIVHGTRDPFGTEAEVSGYGLSAAIQVAWSPDGNHDLAPRRASGRSKERNWREAAETVVAFLTGLSAA